MLRSVPFERGWRVLDAGCGSGGSSLLGRAVGPSGQITAIDLAPDNVAIVQQRLTSWVIPLSTRVQVGTLVSPFPADHFDAVWCSNTLQYLTDTELTIALGEFQRVVRPAGLVAIKDVDSTTIRFEPTPPGFMDRFSRRALASVGAARLSGARGQPRADTSAFCASPVTPIRGPGPL